jgi:hypothetical protein
MRRKPGDQHSERDETDQSAGLECRRHGEALNDAGDE